MIICNARNQIGALTGVQRYTLELLNRLPSNVKAVTPHGQLTGIYGHTWEQLILPFRLHGNLLWSPSNVGPLSVGHQVVSIMDMSPLDHPEWSSKKFSLWYKFLLPRLINRVHAILTISEFSKERIIHYCPKAESKTHVTLLAADSRFHPVNADNIAMSIRQLALPSPRYIVALGSLEPRKNLKTLLEVWSKIHPKLPDDVWLVLAGAKGNNLVFAEQSYNQIPPRVHLTGHVPDELLPALYSGAMASVYLSLYEGFGLPPLESMSCGTPVLTSNTTSLPEVVGDAALTSDPLDIEAIGRNILRLVENINLRHELKYRGLERAKLFSWDKTAKQTWEVLMGASSL